MNRKMVFSLFLLIVFTAGLCLALPWSGKARLFPLMITIAGMLTASLVFVSEALACRTKKKRQRSEQNEENGTIGFDRLFFYSGEFKMILWISGLIGLILVFGFSIAVLVFTTGFMLFFGKENAKTTTVLAGGIWLVIYLVFHVSLKIPLYDGIIRSAW